MTAVSSISVTETSRQSVQTVAGRCLRRRLGSFDCSRCADSCAAGALTVAGVEVHLAKEKCTGCGRCTAVCPAEAIVFSDYDLYEELDRCSTLEGTVFACQQTTHSFTNSFRLPCLGALSMEALLSVGLKATGTIFFDLTGCPACDNHQAVRSFPVWLARVQQAFAEDSQIQLIAITDKENLPCSQPKDRRSFLLDMGGNVLSYIRHRYGSPARDRESSPPATRRLPKKNALLQSTIATCVPAVSATLLSRCLPSLSITASCTLCPRCTGMCPTGALKLTRQPDSGKAHKLTFTAARCTGCGLCAAFCKAKAITIRPPAIF